MVINFGVPSEPACLWQWVSEISFLKGRVSHEIDKSGSIKACIAKIYLYRVRCTCSYRLEGGQVEGKVMIIEGRLKKHLCFQICFILKEVERNIYPLKFVSCLLICHFMSAARDIKTINLSLFKCQLWINQSMVAYLGRRVASPTSTTQNGWGSSGQVSIYKHPILSDSEGDMKLPTQNVKCTSWYLVFGLGQRVDPLI